MLQRGKEVKRIFQVLLVPRKVAKEQRSEEDIFKYYLFHAKQQRGRDAKGMLCALFSLRLCVKITSTFF